MNFGSWVFIFSLVSCSILFAEQNTFYVGPARLAQADSYSKTLPLIIPEGYKFENLPTDHVQSAKLLKNLRAGDIVFAPMYQYFSTLLAKEPYPILKNPKVTFIFDMEIMNRSQFGYSDKLIDALFHLLKNPKSDNVKILLHSEAVKKGLLEKGFPPKALIFTSHLDLLLLNGKTNIQIQKIQPSLNLQSREVKILFIGGSSSHELVLLLDWFNKQYAETGQFPSKKLHLIYAPHPNFPNVYSQHDKDPNRLLWAAKSYERLKYLDFKNGFEMRTTILKTGPEGLRTHDLLTKMDLVLGNSSTVGSLAKQLGIPTTDKPQSFVNFLSSDGSSNALRTETNRNVSQSIARKASDLEAKFNDLLLSHEKRGSGSMLGKALQCSKVYGKNLIQRIRGRDF
ncbi:MAG: hypothetical protein AB8E15_04845 [Bdellovibrionales bacterium]